MQSRKMNAILVPAFNEEQSIAKVVIDSKKFGTVIVCDDGSTDATARIAESLGVVVIRHRKNEGKGEGTEIHYGPPIIGPIGER